MPRLVKRFLVFFLTGTVGCLLLLAWAYWSVRQVPGYYDRAMQLEPQSLEVAGDQFEKQIFRLQSSTQNAGPWQVEVSEDQINGWLAVDLPEKFPRLLPPDIRHPRVDIDGQFVHLACRYRLGQLETVLNLELQVFLAEEANSVAFRICRVRAGTLPLPLQGVLEAVSTAARGAELPLRWQRWGGDPVAIICLGQTGANESGASWRIDQLGIGGDSVRLSGLTTSSSQAPPAGAHPVADQDSALREASSGT